MINTIHVPWIWYYAEDALIQYTRIPKDVLRQNKNIDVSELVKTISPSSPNTDNAEKFSNVILNYSSKKLGDREVMVMKYEYISQKYSRYFFVYGEWLIGIQGAEDISDDWFAKITFKTAELN